MYLKMESIKRSRVDELLEKERKLDEMLRNKPKSAEQKTTDITAKADDRAEFDVQEDNMPAQLPKVEKKENYEFSCDNCGAEFNKEDIENNRCPTCNVELEFE